MTSEVNNPVQEDNLRKEEKQNSALAISLIRNETIEKLKEVVNKEVADLFETWENDEMPTEVVSARAEHFVSHFSSILKNVILDCKNKDSKTLLSTPVSNKFALEELAINATLNRELDTSASTIEKNFNEILQKLQSLRDQRMKFLHEVEELDTARNIAIKKVETESKINFDELPDEPVSK